MEVDEIDLVPSWMDPIIAFLTTGELSTDKAEARRIKYKAVKYHLIDGILYRMGYTLPYLQFVHPSLVSYPLYEIH